VDKRIRGWKVLGALSMQTHKENHVAAYYNPVRPTVSLFLLTAVKHT